jgi:hypothetical protein
MKTITIEFDEYPGEEIVARLSPVPLDTFDAIVDAYIEAAEIIPEKVRALANLFGPLLVSWSFPEPADAAGLGARDPNLIVAIAREWIMGVRTVPLPLPVRSSAGVRSRKARNQRRSPKPSSATRS